MQVFTNPVYTLCHRVWSLNMHIDRIHYRHGWGKILYICVSNIRPIRSRRCMPGKIEIVLKRVDDYLYVHSTSSVGPIKSISFKTDDDPTARNSEHLTHAKVDCSVRDCFERMWSYNKVLYLLDKEGNRKKIHKLCIEFQQV